MANTQDFVVSSATATLNDGGFALLSDDKLDQVSGGFFPFIALGVALGIGYCILDGSFDKPPAPKGDFPGGGSKNIG
jgi:hypothetical protein